MARILVIDDEKEILGVVETFLVRKGLEVMTAQDGKRGLQALDEGGTDIDLIVLDHKMPYLDGAGVLEEMKKRGIRKPVILLTGSIGKDTRDLEVDELLLKPIDLNELFVKIRDLIG